VRRKISRSAPNALIHQDRMLTDRLVVSFVTAVAIAGVFACPVGVQANEGGVVVAGPASGRHAEAMPAMLAGVRQAAGPQADIRGGDDGCDAARAEGAARLIVATKPDLVLGHPCPAAAIAAARVYAAAGVLFIALGVRHPDLTAKRAGPTIFRLAGRDDRQGASAAMELLRLSPTGRVAIVQDRTAYARSLTSAVVAVFAERGLPAPAVVPIVAGRRDYDSELAKLKSAPPEAILFAGYPAEAAVVLSGLRKAGFGSAVIASDANATDEFARAAAGGAGARPGEVMVMVMVRAPGAGGLDAQTLKTAAFDAVSAWEAARPSGDPALALAADGGTALFDRNGDRRIESFIAVPLVAGRWATNANAGPQ
jgi:branched-chain amino acid transport system substrate-binding protein